MFLIYLIIAVIAYYLYRFYFIQRKKYPRGPLPLPILGNTLSLDKFNPGYDINKIGDQYGGLATVWLGAEPNVVITDYELLKEAFITNGEALSWRPDLPIMDFFYGGKYGLALIDGPFWKEQKRFSLHVLRDFGFGRNIMESKIHLEIEHLLEYLRSRAIDGEIRIDPSEFLDKCFASIIANITMGVRYEYDESREFDDLRAANQKFFELFGSTLSWMLNSLPWLQYLPIFGHFGTDEIKENELIIRSYLMPHVEAGRSFVDENPDAEAETFVQAYCKEIKRRQLSGDTSGFDYWQLYCALVDTWSNGFETTAATMEWALLYMALHPAVQEKVHAEIDRVLGKNGRATMAHKNEMPYLSAVVTEIQRCSDIVPMNLQHMAKTDVIVGGHHIPAGASVLGQISAIHKSEKYFHNANEFNPQRFINDPAAAEKVVVFSMGKRQCLGESLARMELFLVFTTLMQKYVVTLSKPVDVNNKRITFTVHPERYECILTERK